LWGGGSAWWARRLQRPAAERPHSCHPGLHGFGGNGERCRGLRSDGQRAPPWQTGLWGALLRQFAAREEPRRVDQMGSCFGLAGQPRQKTILRRWLAADRTRARWWSNWRLRDGGVPGLAGLLALTVSGAASCCGSPSRCWSMAATGRSAATSRRAFRLAGSPEEHGMNPCPAAARLEAEPFFRAHAAIPHLGGDGPAGRGGCPTGGVWRAL